MMLADQGAEVIRVDPPGGPMWDSPANAVLNRGKLSIVLDLKTEGDRAIALRLAASADVLVENFRPAVMARLGLGAEAVTALNPRLVYLSLPGFSAGDGERTHLQAWEGVIAAAVGQFTDMGLNRILMGINPSFSPLPLASAYAAVFGAMAVTFALFARARHGRGEVVEVPIAAALLEALAYNTTPMEDLPDRYKSLREREIERRRAAGLAMDLSYAELQEFLDPFYRTYACADGRPFYLVCGSHVTHPVRALELLGLWDEMQAAGIPLVDPYLPLRDWPEGVDCTLKAYPLSKDWTDRLSARMKQAFLARGAFEWERRFGEAGVPGCAHRTTREWLASEHALASGLVLEVEDPAYGAMRQAGNVAWLAGSAERVLDKRPAPRPDADRAAILESLPELPEPEKPVPGDAAGGWLEGLRILDLTNVIAGPTIAATLARFGAEVISVDPTAPALDPWNTIVFGLQANRGKRSLLADLKTPEGQEILCRLLKQVDVVTVNALDRQLAPLGLDPQRLAAANPDLILCQLDAFGGPRRGPRSGYPGYDDLVQAATGIMARFGGGLETPEEHAHFGTIDVLAGFCADFALGLALVQRSRGGGAEVARASLAAAGQLIQIPFMYDYAGRAPFDEPSGRAVKGAHALYRCYETADGWLFLAAKKQRLTTLASLSDFAEAAALPEAALEGYLEEGFRRKPRAHWIEALAALDLGVQATGSLAQTKAANLLRESAGRPDLRAHPMAFIRHDRHPSGHVVDLVAPVAVRPKTARIELPAAAPKYGAQTREILAGLGYGAAEIDALLAKDVVAERWSDDYLPD
jgi:crotonobetainyl-CoA:carnitine CoA-transferase CaiB-like acyl-CoA transferase